VDDEHATPLRMEFPEMVWTLCPLEIAPVAGLRGTATPSFSRLSPTPRHWVDDDGQATPGRSTVPEMVWTLCPLEIAPVAGLRGTATPSVSKFSPTARHWVDDGQATPLK
jgi:hypothetical protein